MSDKQARLVAAIADAMEAQGISQNTLGRKSGVAQSMISAAILGKYDLKEEKWRLLCETLRLDYDEIVEDPELPPSLPDGVAADLKRKAETVTAEETRGGTAVPLSETTEQEEDIIFNEEERHLLDVTARYLAGHLKEDIRKGMDISLEDLHTLLTVCKRMQAAAEQKPTDE